MNSLPPSYDLLVRFSQWAWSTSLEAWPLALAVVLAGWSGWISARTRAWLAGLFFLRLMLPAVPAVAWPWAHVAPRVVAESTSRASSVVAPAISWASVWPIVWVVGVMAVTVWLTVSHLRLSRWISLASRPVSPTVDRLALHAMAEAGLPRRVPLCALEISTPAIFGWWRPRLLVPLDLEERFTPAQIRAMLLHELAHVRRRDVLATWLSLIVCTLHWFNPLAWLVCRCFGVDREVLCDAAALARRDQGFRHDYGEALLRALQGPAPLSAPALAPFFQLHRELRRRLHLIMKPTPPSIVARLLAVLLVPSLGLVTFTTAKAEPKPAPAEEDGTKPKPESDGVKKPGDRDGEGPKKGPRDGEGPKKGPRDGEGDGARKGPKDGEGEKKREGDGDGNKRKGPREGDGDVKKGPRDGDAPKKGPRDGETKRNGPRDGDTKKEGPRDGDKPKPAEGDGEKPKAE